MFETKTPNSDLPRVLGEFGRELDAAIGRAERDQRLMNTPPPEPTSSRRRGFAIAFAAAATVVIVVMLAFGIGGKGSTVGVQDALAEVAHRLAIAPHPKPSQFEYTRTRSIDLGIMDAGIDQMGRRFETFRFSSPGENEWAISATRDGRGRMRGGDPVFPTAEDERIGQPYFDSFQQREQLARTASGRKRLRVINRRVMNFNKSRGVDGIIGISGSEWTPAYNLANGQVYFGGENLTPEQLAKYPRDPKAMYERMRGYNAEQQKRFDKRFAPKMNAEERVRSAQRTPDLEEEIWHALTESHWNAIPVTLLAARVRALAYLPGVEAAGEGTDDFGRVGPKFTWTHDGIRHEIVFDKETSVLLMSRARIVDPAALRAPELRTLPAGTTTNQFQLVDQKTLNQRPKFR